jgi:hypothetical protein
MEKQSRHHCQSQIKKGSSRGAKKGATSVDVFWHFKAGLKYLEKNVPE